MDNEPSSTSTSTSNESLPKPMHKFKKRSITKSASSFLRKRQRPPQHPQSAVQALSSSNSVDEDAPANDRSNDNIEIEKGQDTDDDNGEGIENEPNSGLDLVLATERRRKLIGRRSRGINAISLSLSSYSTTKGLDGSTKLCSKSKIVDNEGVEKKHSTTDFQGQLLLGGRTFAGGKSTGSNDMSGPHDEDQSEGILAMKHKMAMEEFIRQNLREKQDPVISSDTSGMNGNLGNCKNHNEQNNKILSSDFADRELYAELLLSAKKENDDRGNIMSTGEGGGSEGDVGAGGAVMGGTGIAEVALPIDERLRAARTTEMAALERERQRMANRYPSNGEPEKSMIVSSSALPKGSTTFSSSYRSDNVHAPSDQFLGASYSHNFQLHTKEWVSRRRDERQIEIDAIRATQEETERNTTVENQERIGFEAARKLAKQVGEGGGGSISKIIEGNDKTINNRAGAQINDPSMRNEWDRNHDGSALSNDERVWRTFMTKQRNRR